MEVNELQERIDNFYEYMGRDKRPSPSRIRLWYEKLSFINHKDIFEAFDWMKDNLDSIPFNIPKAVKTANFIVNRNKPEMQGIPYKAHRLGICDECEGTGIFKTREFINGLFYEQIQFCADCDNWQQWTNTSGTRVTRKELEMLNVKFKPYNKVLKYSKPSGDTGTEEELKELAKGIGNKMPGINKAELESQKEAIRNYEN